MEYSRRKWLTGKTRAIFRSSTRISISGNLSRNDYPWLCDPKPVHFRYGDYSSLKRNYLPPDYLRDAAGLNIVKTVHEDALCDPSDPAGEPRWPEQVAQEYEYPRTSSAPRSFRATTSSECSRDMRSTS